jgi:hypothetical protein
MKTDDWYRNTNWNSKIASDFESRLKRAKKSYNKAEYLRIQANYLLNSRNKRLQQIGVQLINRLFVEFYDEESSVICGKELIGDYLLKNKKFNEAENYYREVFEYYNKKQNRSGTSGNAELKIAKTILAANVAEKFEEAYTICENFPLNYLLFNDEKFYYASLRAQLSQKIGKINESVKFAKAAIEISKNKAPQFGKHKTLGLVKTTQKELTLLKKIIIDSQKQIGIA